MVRGVAGSEAATGADQLVAARAAEVVAWMIEWGFADLPSAPTGLRSRQGRRPPGLSDEEVLGVVEDRYRRPDHEARLLNAHRVHAGRQALVDQGTFSVKEIAATRGQSVNTVHKQIQRACERGELFTVALNGERHVPAALLDEALGVREQWRPVVSALGDAGMTGWGIWRWIAEPNAGLSGEIAADVIAADPDRVYAAARRRAAQTAA